jgi:hypothetical protein
MKDKKKTTKAKTKTAAKTTKAVVRTPEKKISATATATSINVTIPVDAKCSKCVDAITCFFNTPYNWGVVVLTLAIWVLTSFFSYYNSGNFDMLLTLHNYIQLLALVAIITGLMRADNKQYMFLTKYGISAYFLSILAIICTRNTFVAINFLAHFLLKPASIFFFLLIVKQIWNIAVGKSK